jgi:hypothetical protein
MLSASSETSANGDMLVVARAMIARGQRLDAIDILSAANRADRSLDVDRQLVRLRHDAFAELQNDSEPVPWPPEIDDPFPDVDDLLEVDAHELTSEVMGGSILHHGCVLVRDLLPGGVASRLVEDADRAFEAQQRWRLSVKSGSSDRATTGPWFEAFLPNAGYGIAPRHLSMARMSGDAYRVLLVDSPPAMFDVLTAFENAGMRQLLIDYLGQRPVMTVSRSVLRRFPHKPQTLGWHQDAAVFGRPAPSLNCWVALTECGYDAPGLEVLPVRVDGIVGTPANRRLSRSDLVAAPLPGKSVTPIFGPGDALFFDDLHVHRTAMTDSMTKPRYSIESWFFTAAGFPSNNAPVVF